MDLLWAAGWPMLLIVDDAPSRDLAAESRALFEGALWDWGARFSRDALWAYLRVMRDGAWGEQGQLSDESERMFGEVISPWSDEDARAMIARWTHPQRALASTGRLVPWAIEAVTSAELVVDATLDAVESWSDATMAEWGVGSCQILHQLGFVLPRLSEPSHARAIARLVAQRERAERCWPHAPHELDSIRELGWHFATLDLLVGGDQAALARGALQDGAPLPSGLDFVCDERIVAEACERFATGRRAGLSPRALYNGGERALRWYCASWKKFTGDDEHARFVRVLGEVRSPLVTECMLAMAADSKAKKLARLWFDRRSEYARETLPALERGPHGELAKKILRDLA
jgi:hypothetical protein